MDVNQAQGWVMILIAIGTTAVAIINSWRNGTKLAAVQTEVAVAKVNVVEAVESQTAVIEVIEKNTNSRVSKQDTQIEALAVRVEDLLKQISLLEGKLIKK